ncbi:MAG: NOG1 family protein [Candidatus Natronoplasma sp.]
MDFNITPVLKAEQLLDKAFGRASKKVEQGNNTLERKKKTVSAKLNSIAHTIEDTLGRYEEEFPTLDALPEFYFEVIDITIGIDRLKKSIGAVNWGKRRVKRTMMKAAREVVSEEDIEEIEKIRKKAYARTDSFLKQVDEDLKFLEEARKKLNSLPDIKEDHPTVAVAGYPNVGKSELVSRLSTGKPKIATYPFTTKEVGIGHFNLGYQKCQMLDTPGMLDRPREERNEIEMQAAKALESLADVIVFIYDPSETCGYPLEKQEALCNEIKKELSEVEMIEVENKIDLKKSESDRLKISALKEENLEELKTLIKKILKERYPIDEVSDEDLGYFSEPDEAPHESFSGLEKLEFNDEY